MPFLTTCESFSLLNHSGEEETKKRASSSPPRCSYGLRTCKRCCYLRMPERSTEITFISKIAHILPSSSLRVYLKQINPGLLGFEGCSSTSRRGPLGCFGWTSRCHLRTRLPRQRTSSLADMGLTKPHIAEDSLWSLDSTSSREVSFHSFSIL